MAHGAQAASNGGEIDTSFLDEFINENDFSNSNNTNSISNNNNQPLNMSVANQNLNEQASKARNNKSKFDIYLPNI